MADTKAKKIRLIYGFCFLALTVIVGGLFIMQTLRIYLSGTGGDIYTRELVLERLGEIAVPFVLWLIAVVAGVVLWKLFPAEENKLLAATDAKTALVKIKRRLPAQHAAEAAEFATEYKRMKKEQLLRLAVWSVFAVVTLVWFIGVISYLETNVGGEKTEIFASVLHCLALGLVLIAVAYAAVVVTDVMRKRELATAKAVLAGLAKKGVKLPVKGKEKKLRDWRILFVARVALAAIGVTLFIVGFNNGGVENVLGKAVIICQECIGLG